jgi:drug/metabolite transporter (DMT)-like permease
MFVGELAALGAALGFSMTSICYTFAGRKLNAVTSIAMSLPISWIVLMVLHRLTLGEFLPTGVALDRVVYLSISGVLAFVIASYFVLNAYQSIGPRLTMLILSFAPVLGAIFAWIFLGQVLPLHAVIGILMVISGIVWVVIERGKPADDQIQLDMRRGVMLASLGTLAQAASFVFASQGLYGNFPAFSAALIRIGAGIVAMWVFIAFQRKIGTTLAVLNERRLLLLLIGAAVSGPVISGSLLLVSFQTITVGVATTLSHTTAIMLIPISYVVFKERISRRAMIGTMISVAGIAVLFV